MRKKVRLTHALAVGVLVAGLTVVGSASAKENPANDCLVGLQGPGETPDVSVNISAITVSCTDGDACDDDGATNGTCSFKLRGCVNLPDVSGCTARPIKKVKFKTGNQKNLIVLTPSATEPSSVCGSFVDFNVALKKKGKKPAKAGKRKIIANATANVKPLGKNKDTDKITFICNPCPTESCVPPTTTTTTPPTTTTTLPPGCGDGIVNNNEACDPAAQTTGCGAGETCLPAGAINECTCKTCTPLAQTLQFVTSTQTTGFCGDPGLITPPDPPTLGSVTTDDATNIPLGAGCLYIGGGGSSVPGGVIPDGSASNFDITQDCGGELVVAGKAATDAASRLSCTQGAGPGKACINDLTNWPNLTACTTDDDCPKTGAGSTTAAGSCVDKPNCLFGPPLPIENGPLSTCVVNTIGTAANGSVIKTTGDGQITLPLRSHTFIRPPADTTPCPVCDTNTNTCTTGARAGLACSTTSTVQGTSIDCPPSPNGGAYLPEFQVNLEKLTTGTSTKTNPDGVFCPDQKTFSAFGGQNSTVRPPGDPTNPPIKIVTITEQGSPAGDLSGGAALPATISTVFCIPATGNGLIDGAADLAGPGAVSLPGTMQILP